MLIINCRWILDSAAICFSVNITLVILNAELRFEDVQRGESNTKFNYFLDVSEKKHVKLIFTPINRENN